MRHSPTAAPPVAESCVAWTTSGIMEPGAAAPVPNRSGVSRLQFKNPLHLTMPGTDRLFVPEQAGKISSFPNRPDVDKAISPSTGRRTGRVGSRGKVQGSTRSTA